MYGVPVLSPTGPSLRLKTLAKGKPTIGVLAEMVAMAPQLDWWHTYLAILLVDEVQNTTRTSFQNNHSL